MKCRFWGCVTNADSGVLARSDVGQARGADGLHGRCGAMFVGVGRCQRRVGEGGVAQASRGRLAELMTGVACAVRNRLAWTVVGCGEGQGGDVGDGAACRDDRWADEVVCYVKR